MNANNIAIEASKTSEQNKIKEQNQLEVIKLQQQAIVISTADAERNRLQYQAETDKLSLQKEQLTPQLIQKAWIDKWDGKLPAYLITTSENANVLMQLPTGKEIK